jgi:uncharacterized BrkB/YihY/UPF0761 family membrane protein
VSLLFVSAEGAGSKRTTIPGAIVAAVGWLILAWALGFFIHERPALASDRTVLTESKLNAVYGVFATPIALLTWLKWGAIVVLIGAEINVNLGSAIEFAGGSRTEIKNKEGLGAARNFIRDLYALLAEVGGNSGAVQGLPWEAERVGN